jgi:hypothetical protein
MANAIKKDNIPREKDCLEKMEITIRPLTPHECKYFQSQAH